ARIRPGELHSRVDGDQLGDRLRYHDGGQIAVLIDHRGINNPRTRRQDAQSSPLEGEHRSQVVVKVEVGVAADDLRKVVLAGCGRGVALLLDIEESEGKALIIAKGQLLCLAKSQPHEAGVCRRGNGWVRFRLTRASQSG